MNFSTQYQSHTAELVDLFTDSFTVSEGAEEGALIHDFVEDLLTHTPDEDLRVVSAWDGGALVGAIVFSRLTYSNESRCAFILSPVAVAPTRQRQGIGQAMLQHGLDGLRAEAVDFVTTYGDPTYYSQVGFAQIDETTAAAPLRLSFPDGWLGQFLSADTSPLRGACSCVNALNRQDIW